MTLISKKWSFGTADLEDAHKIRREVFMVEQNVSEEEELIEWEDKLSHHLVIYLNGEAIATGRIVLNNEISLGRIAVLKPYRGQKYGEMVMYELLDKARELNIPVLYLHSQTYAIKFYEKFGFVAYGEEFMDAGIPHYHMKLTL